MNRLFRKCLPALLVISLTLSVLSPMNVHAAERIQTVSDKLVIVIDPGHGGSNQGTLEGFEDEKYMTLTTALAMYEELCRYDDVEVYLTRTDDSSMIIADRAAFAKSVNADFLFSIHYNASENHTLFGTEIWIPSAAPFNGYGYQFGYEFLSQMQDKGLFLRGIKTRLNDKGTDYYGIIREAAALDIPAVILEHCHVDEARDAEYCDSEEDFIQFGIDDATAVAKYFGLKSSELDVDYSDYQLAEINANPIPGTLRDDTQPDVCMIEFADASYELGTMSFTVSAADYDSVLLYYDYSIDGGLTYSPRMAWPGSNALDGSYEDTFTLSLLIPSGTKPSVILRAYNLFDLFTESNRYDSQEAFIYGQASEPETETEPGTDAQAGSTAEEEQESSYANAAAVANVYDDAETQHEVSFVTFLEICLVVVIALFIILLISQAISYHNRKKRRRQRRNDAGANRNQHR